MKLKKRVKKKISIYNNGQSFFGRIYLYQIKMKKQILSVLLTVFFAAMIHAQNCLPEGITFSTQSQIDSFQVNYPGCTIIEGNVVISGDDITNLNGLSVLTAVESDLGIDGNPLLSNLSGLHNVTQVGADFDIADNASLTDLTGLESLIYTGLDLSIEFNPNLLNLSGVENLKTIGAELVILENDKLSTLTGLENLSRIETAISINSNPVLASLEGLSALDTLVGGLLINNNLTIESLTGLDSVAILNGPVNIQNNPLLSVCSVKSICDYLNNGGNAIIANNQTSCNSILEVQTACITSAKPLIGTCKNLVSIYPNPCFDKMFIKLNNEELCNARIYNIYNQLFKTVILYHGKNEINISGFPSGVYYISINYRSGLKTLKFVKK